MTGHPTPSNNLPKPHSEFGPRERNPSHLKMPMAETVTVRTLFPELPVRVVTGKALVNTESYQIYFSYIFTVLVQYIVQHSLFILI